MKQTPAQRRARPVTLSGAAALLLACAAAAEPTDRWRNCGPATLAPMGPAHSEADLEPGTLEVDADEAELYENGLKTFRGDVSAVRGGEALRGDEVVYDEEGARATVTGGARLWNDAIYWSGDRAELDLANDVVTLGRGSYQLRADGGRGHGLATRAVDDAVARTTRFEDVEYSTCSGETPDWQMRVGRLRLDHAGARGSARDVVLRVRDVPVFWLPWISFPLNDDRKSGFLVPSFGSSNKNSTDVTTPFYLNLAPEYDAILTPRYLGERGVQFGGQFRYLAGQGQGQLEFTYLPEDRDLGDDERSLVGFQHQQVFADGRASVFATYASVSDPAYFEDFGNSLSVTGQQFLEQRGDLSFNYGSWVGLLRVQNFESLDPTLASAGPYQRLPQIFLSGPLRSGGNRRVNVAMNAEANYFERDASVVGARFDLRPDVSLPWRSAAGYVVPRVGLRMSQYSLSSDPAFDGSATRIVPIVSLDNGLYLEREGALFGERLLQTLEPRVYYLFVAERDQDRIPVFDSGLYDFTYSQLFRDDRFAGGDRVGDTHQVTLALTSRLFEEGGGRERLRGSVGQIVYFEDRDVVLPGQERDDDGASELVGEAVLRVLDGLRLIGNITWDPQLTQTRRSTLGLRYAPDDQRVLNLGYRIRRTARIAGIEPEIEQFEASAHWPLSPRWGAVGRWVYSLAGDNNLETVGGLEYDSCCWAARAVVRRYLTAAEGAFDTGVFLQVELKGLAGLGQNTADYLEDYIPGYRSRF